jgi:hypothetical protein
MRAGFSGGRESDWAIKPARVGAGRGELDDGDVDERFVS